MDNNDKLAIESIITYCDDMMIAEEGSNNSQDKIEFIGNKIFKKSELFKYANIRLLTTSELKLFNPAIECYKSYVKLLKEMADSLNRRYKFKFFEFVNESVSKLLIGYDVNNQVILIEGCPIGYTHIQCPGFNLMRDMDEAWDEFDKGIGDLMTFINDNNRIIWNEKYYQTPAYGNREICITPCDDHIFAPDYMKRYKKFIIFELDYYSSLYEK